MSQSKYSQEYENLDFGETNFYNSNRMREADPSACSDEVSPDALKEYIEGARFVMEPTCDKIQVIGYEPIIQDILLNIGLKISPYKPDENKKVSDSAGLRGSILAGVPGLGKTSILRSIASQAARLFKMDISYFNVTTSMLKSKYHGESCKLVTYLYEIADKYAPSFLLIDEIDGMCAKRDDDEAQSSIEFKNTLLSAMCGVIPHPNVFTFGSTNKPDSLDESFVRRFDSKYILRLPSEEERILLARHFVMFETGMTVEEHGLKDFDQKFVEILTDGFTGQNISNAVKLAVSKAADFVYMNKVIPKDQLFKMCDIIEKGKEPLQVARNVITMDILKTEGIERITPARDDTAERRIEDWALKNCQNALDTAENDKDILDDDDFSLLRCCCNLFN